MLLKEKKKPKTQSCKSFIVVLHFRCCWKFASNIGNAMQAVTKYVLLMGLIFHFVIVSVGSVSDLSF